MVTHYYNKTMIDFGEGTLNPHRTHYNDTVNIKTVLIFYPNVTRQLSYLGLLRMRTSILHSYLMYLHYCKGRFRVGVEVNETQSNNLEQILLVSGSCMASIHNREYNT